MSTDVAAHLNAALSGRYFIEREIGAGGMATVYLAHDLKHDRKVALKVLKPELAAAVDSERFLQEINVTANLQHPHILPLFDSGTADRFLYYVMPYVAGESLRDRITREGRLPVSDALAIAGDVAAALTTAHAQGIVHRDVKPANILLKDGEGLVADFGVALAVSAVGQDRLTGIGIVVGTPTYMSPEQIAGDQSIDGRSDTYSLACVLFEMLTGEPPFTGPTVHSVIRQTLLDPPPSAMALRKELTPAIDAALVAALSKEATDRFDSPRAFIEACRPARPLATRGRWQFAATAAAVVLLVAAFPRWQNGRTEQARRLIPEIARLTEDRRYVEAYDLAVKAEQRLQDDTTLARLFTDVSDLLSVRTEPAGARVFLQRLPATGESASLDSVLMGTTPLNSTRVARIDHRISIHKENHATVERMASSAFGRSEQGVRGRNVNIRVVLLPSDSVPPGMVAVPGGTYRIVSPDVPPGLSAGLQPFFIDRFEVTNQQYAEFVRSGGYARAAWWSHAVDAQPNRFVDRTALPGPRGWTSQEPPRGQERHPVTGVSWYEAAAYCASVGKLLPTLYEWEKAARDGVVQAGDSKDEFSHLGVIMPWGHASAVIQSERRANFSSSGTMPVDSLPFGISPYGAHAMAGNVKEWLANGVGDGFAVAGGSWEDPAYLFSELGSVPGTAANAAIGFRCARSAGVPSGNQGADPLMLDAPTPIYRPVNAAAFAALLSHYRYDRQPSNARGMTVTETADWSRRRLWIDGLDGDSILAYLYLPKRAAAPFSTLVYVASSGAFFYRTVSQEVEEVLGPHIKAGRAVLVVALKGMLERPNPPDFTPPPSSSVRFRDLMVLHATELRLGMDYLETLDDIDMQRLAYAGLSLGAGSRLTFAAVDDRFQSVVLIGAGIDERMHPTLPEASNINFAPYIKPPKLVINGRQDEEHPWLTRGLPLWNLLSEPKELVLIEGAGHQPPAEQRVPPINAFLDRTLGPVVPR